MAVLFSDESLNCSASFQTCPLFSLSPAFGNLFRIKSRDCILSFPWWRSTCACSHIVQIASTMQAVLYYTEMRVGSSIAKQVSCKVPTLAGDLISVFPRAVPCFETGKIHLFSTAHQLDKYTSSIFIVFQCWSYLAKGLLPPGISWLLLGHWLMSSREGDLKVLPTGTSASGCRGCWMWGNPSSGCLVTCCLWDISYQCPAPTVSLLQDNISLISLGFAIPIIILMPGELRLCHQPCIRNSRCSLSDAAIEGRSLKPVSVFGGGTQRMCIFSSSRSLIILWKGICYRMLIIFYLLTHFQAKLEDLCPWDSLQSSSEGEWKEQPSNFS